MIYNAVSNLIAERKMSKLVIKKRGEMFMIYGYARVSTKNQAKDGNSLEAQIKALAEELVK